VFHQVGKAQEKARLPNVSCNCCRLHLMARIIENLDPPKSKD
jgi:hypothetical protein